MFAFTVGTAGSCNFFPTLKFLTALIFFNALILQPYLLVGDI